MVKIFFFLPDPEKFSKDLSVVVVAISLLLIGSVLTKKTTNNMCSIYPIICAQTHAYMQNTYIL